MLPTISQQISPVDANAGNQSIFTQTVNLPASIGGNAYATPTIAPQPVQGITTPGSTSSSQTAPQWASWLLYAALAWWALNLLS